MGKSEHLGKSTYASCLLYTYDERGDNMTTQLLERAFTQAAQLSAREQDTLATIVIEEMETEKRWDESFAGSQDMLAQMAKQALSEHRQNKTRRLNVDDL